MKLSEEEIIKIISDDIIGYQVGYEAHEEAVKGLLDLYQKEKEKNKNLELCLKAEEKYSEGLNEDIKSLLNIEPNDNFISKDKIKAKIEKLDKRKRENQGNFFILDELIIDKEIQVLQELLEEKE